MKTNCKKSCRPFVSDHGEAVWELIGKTATTETTKHSLAHVEIEPGKASQPHHHPEAEESYCILSGKAKMIIDGEMEVLTSGMSVLIPPKKIHQIINDGPETLTFLAVCVPAWTPDCVAVK